MQRSLVSFLRRFGLVICFLGAFACRTEVCAGDLVVLGDSQSYAYVHDRLVKIIVEHQPSAVFRVGDLVNDGLDPKQWEDFNRIEEPLLSAGPYYPALGNHEMDSPLYFKNFPYLYGARWYSVQEEGIHFIILDSNSDLRQGSPQYLWLEEDLKGIDESLKYRVVIFHHPLFSSGYHREDEKGLRSILLPLLQEYGVCAVFSGHDHNYERLEFEGTVFVVTGGGGSALRDRARTSPYSKKFIKEYHFCLLSVEDSGLRVRVIDSNRNEIDSFVITSRILVGAQNP